LPISNCRTLDNRMLGCSILGVTPLARLENISYPHISLNCPRFFALAVPKQFRYPVWGQEPSSQPHTNCRLLSEEKLFSPAYYAVGTSGYTVKFHITSVALWLDCLQTSLFISIEDNS
jgi:hypothetical protein